MDIGLAVNCETKYYLPEINRAIVAMIGETKRRMIETVNPILIKGNETTYEIAKVQMNTFITLTQKITLKLENGKCVVSNVE